jgi:flagellar biosynthesis protein
MNNSDHKPKKRAVALHYDGEHAPHITARGVDAIAEEIIAIAREHSIPLREDNELVAMLSQLDLGDEVPEELYVVVAEVLAFAYFITGRFPEDKR